MNILQIPIEEVTPYTNNPRCNDTAVNSVAESIKEFGFKVPIIIDKNNVIVAGHTRVKAAKMLGLESVPCIMADDLSEEQVNAFRLADNKVAEAAEWHFDKLEEELNNISIDMSVFGFESLIEELEPEVVEDDYSESLPAEPKAKTGDIYQLGRKGDRATEGIKRVHPTQKPVGLLSDILKDFSSESDNILDCFGGSGSTLMACEQLNRNCYMMEYEPHYIDVIIDRWENFTGKKAVLVDG